MQAEILENDFRADGQFREHSACSSIAHTTALWVRINLYLGLFTGVNEVGFRSNFTPFNECQNAGEIEDLRWLATANQRCGSLISMSQVFRM